MAATDPTTPQALTQVLVTQIPFILGGIIAIASGVLGSVLPHLLKTSSDQRERRRTKLEEIVSLTFEVEQWLQCERDYFWWGKEKFEGTSPLDKCRPMTNLYFPELQDSMSNFWHSAMELHQWNIVGGQEKNKLGAVSQAHMDSYVDVAKPFHSNHLAFINRAAEIMRTLK